MTWWFQGDGIPPTSPTGSGLNLVADDAINLEWTENGRPLPMQGFNFINQTGQTLRIKISGHSGDEASLTNKDFIVSGVDGANQLWTPIEAYRISVYAPTGTTDVTWGEDWQVLGWTKNRKATM